MRAALLGRRSTRQGIRGFGEYIKVPRTFYFRSESVSRLVIGKMSEANLV
jgi:hypothetical protein